MTLEGWVILKRLLGWRTMEEQRVVNASSNDLGYADIKNRQGLTGAVSRWTIVFLTIIGAFESKESESRKEKKMKRYKELIRDYRTTYERPNDIYLSIWCTSAITLACETISFWVNFGRPEVIFVEALFFILINTLLCTLFSLIAFWFFVMVRPGETKLHLYQMYFDI